MALFRIALRNLTRHPLRSGLTVFAMAFGLVVVMFMAGLLAGMRTGVTRQITTGGMGELQVAQSKFFEDFSVQATLENSERLLASIEALPGVVATPRLIGGALVGHGPLAEAVAVWGIDPAREVKLSAFADKLWQGQFLSEGPEAVSAGSPPVYPAVLGKTLARNLEVSIGDELVLLSSALDGSMASALLRVKGILSSTSPTLDRATMLVDRRWLQELLVAQGRDHQIVVAGTAGQPLPQLQRVVAQAVSTSPGVQVKSWAQLMPTIDKILELNDIAQLIILFIVVGVAALGVINTLFMSIYERTHELGVLMAIGLTPAKVAKLVLLESLALLLISLLVGGAAGVGVVSYLGKHGLDISLGNDNMTVGDVNVATRIFLELHGKDLALGAAVVVGVTLLFSLFPAVKAARLNLVAALKTE